jgi:DUF4097 and DUF4098 domain-containing protein YvlB
METRNRTVWIVVAIVVVLCCCALAVAAAVAVGAGWFTLYPVSRSQVGLGAMSERTEQSFNVGAAPNLTVDNFAGNVTLRAGAAGTVQVIATKRASNQAGLNRIDVQVEQQQGGLLVRTSTSGIPSNLSVQLEITAPAGALLDVHTGAGTLDVQGFSGAVKVDTGAGSVSILDVQGSIVGHTGAGSIDVQGATGQVQVDSGAGSIDYLGTPQGDCRFESGTGSIRLSLPANLGATLDLSTGVGDVSVAFAVAGQVSKREVQGTIGGGGETSIYAHTGTGSIDLIRR